MLGVWRLFKPIWSRVGTVRAGPCASPRGRRFESGYLVEADRKTVLSRQPGNDGEVLARAAVSDERESGISPCRSAQLLVRTSGSLAR